MATMQGLPDDDGGGYAAAVPSVKHRPEEDSEMQHDASDDKPEPTLEEDDMPWIDVV